jgi:hypothetical protein
MKTPLFLEERSAFAAPLRRNQNLKYTTTPRIISVPGTAKMSISLQRRHRHRLLCCFRATTALGPVSPFPFAEPLWSGLLGGRAKRRMLSLVSEVGFARRQIFRWILLVGRHVGALATAPSRLRPRDCALATAPSRLRPRDCALATAPSRLRPRDCALAGGVARPWAEHFRFF